MQHLARLLSISYQNAAKFILFISIVTNLMNWGKNDQKTQEAVLDCHIFSWPSNPFRYSVILQEVNTGTVTELFDEARTNGTCLQIDSACFR